MYCLVHTLGNQVTGLYEGQAVGFPNNIMPTKYRQSTIHDKRTGSRRLHYFDKDFYEMPATAGTQVSIVTPVGPPVNEDETPVGWDNFLEENGLLAPEIATSILW